MTYNSALGRNSPNFAPREKRKKFGGAKIKAWPLSTAAVLACIRDQVRKNIRGSFEQLIGFPGKMWQASWRSAPTSGRSATSRRRRVHWRFVQAGDLRLPMMKRHSQYANNVERHAYLVHHGRIAAAERMQNGSTPSSSSIERVLATSGADSFLRSACRFARSAISNASSAHEARTSGDQARRRRADLPRRSKNPSTAAFSAGSAAGSALPAAAEAMLGAGAGTFDMPGVGTV